MLWMGMVNARNFKKTHLFKNKTLSTGEFQLIKFQKTSWISRNLLLTPTSNSQSKESKITRQSLIQYKPIRWSSGSWTVVLMTRATACNSGENTIFRADRGSRPWLTTIKFKQQILKVKIMKYRKGATILALFPRWKHFSWKLCHNLRILRKKSSLLTIL